MIAAREIRRLVRRATWYPGVRVSLAVVGSRVVRVSTGNDHPALPDHRRGELRTYHETIKEFGGLLSVLQ